MKIPVITPATEYKALKSHKFMKSIANGGFARFILLEACVETGRTYEAWKRSGFDEARERATEEFTGAVFWLGGVPAFNAINDKIGKYLLKMRTADFSLGHDKAREPLTTFLHNERTPQGKPFTKMQIAAFKAAKVTVSVLLANAMIGFVVPKINQSITRYYHRNDGLLPQNDSPVVQNATKKQKISAMDKFIHNASETQKDKTADKKNIPFGSATSALMSIAFNLENNATWQLLSTDVGTAGGRALSARNKDERREILFRDLSSIIFYMWSMPLINKIMNKIEQGGRGVRIDSMNADYVKTVMTNIVTNNGGQMSADDLHKVMLGDDNFKLADNIKQQFKKGYMTLNEFKSKIPEIVSADKVSKFTQIAEKMAKLQPAVAGVERITIEQAERVFKGGYLNNPEFLHEMYSVAFGMDKKTGSRNFLDPYRFISASEFEAVDDDLKFFVNSIVKKAKKTGKEITEETLSKATKINSRFNILNWGTGFAVSALFLSTFIPKMQYWITRKTTGSNDFPGTKEFREKQQAQKK